MTCFLKTDPASKISCIQVQLQHNAGSYLVVEFNMWKPDVPLQQEEDNDKQDVILMIANSPVALHINNNNNNDKNPPLVTQDDSDDKN